MNSTIFIMHMRNCLMGAMPMKGIIICWLAVGDMHEKKTLKSMGFLTLRDNFWSLTVVYSLEGTCTPAKFCSTNWRCSRTVLEQLELF